jgi:hypothetical protein
MTTFGAVSSFEKYFVNSRFFARFVVFCNFRMTDNEAKVPQLCDITGVTAQEAMALLEMSNGNLDAAIGLYYETGVPQPQHHEPREERREPVKVDRPSLNVSDEKAYTSDPSTAVDGLMKKALEHGAKSIGEVLLSFCPCAAFR